MSASAQTCMLVHRIKLPFGVVLDFAVCLCLYDKTRDYLALLSA
jgi:hypothetical protein